MLSLSVTTGLMTNEPHLGQSASLRLSKSFLSKLHFDPCTAIFHWAPLLIRYLYYHFFVLMPRPCSSSAVDGTLSVSSNFEAFFLPSSNKAESINNIIHTVICQVWFYIFHNLNFWASWQFHEVVRDDYLVKLDKGVCWVHSIRI